MPDTDPSLGLAELFLAGDFPGTLSEYFEQLDAEYRAIVADPGIHLWGKRVVAGCLREPDGRDRTFWHMITTGEGQRKLDLRRCALLPRVRDLLERLAAGDLRACWWRERRPGKGKRLCVCPVDFSLKIVLAETPGTFILCTAHPVTKWTRRGHVMSQAARALAAASPAPSDCSAAPSSGSQRESQLLFVTSGEHHEA